MNREVEGRKLALLLLIPLAIIAIALWIALGAVGGDDAETVTLADPLPTATTGQLTAPTLTVAPSTAPIEEPTEIPSPTPLQIAAAELPTSLPTLTPVGGASDGNDGDEGDEGGSETADPTAPPAPATATPASGSGNATPVPQPTPTPDSITIGCAAEGSLPTSAAVGAAVGPFTATTQPGDAYQTMTFAWDFGDNRTAGARVSPAITYDTAGSYTIRVTGTTSDGQQLTATCTTVQVGQASDNSVRDVACTIRPADGSTAWADSGPGDDMLVRATWKPAAQPLDLIWSFDALDALVFANGAVSPFTTNRSFTDANTIASVFWENPGTGEVGRAFCPAFPNASGETTTPVATTGATSTPTTVGSTTTPTPTSSFATATPTVGSTTPTPTVTSVAATATPTIGTATSTPAPTATTVAGATATPTSVFPPTATPTP